MHSGLRSRVLGALVAVTAVVTPALVVGQASPAQAVTTTAAQLLSGLPVATESTATYSRDYFEHWIDADSDGCDTRAEVLIAESQTAATVGAGCTVTTGQWISWYDGATWTDPADVDIDHMVPLQEAWQSGAAAWTAAQRRDYANDLGFAGSLVAVTDNVNQSKGAGDPAEWLPPATGVHCTYAVQWVAVKYRWSLTVDTAEKSALTSLLSGGCGTTSVTVSKAALNSDRLTTGQTLSAGQSLLSPNGAFRLTMQSDGNLVAYRTGGGAIWNSRTGGNPGARAVLQAGDGNFVVYTAAGKGIWANGARGTGVVLRIQNDGNLVEYSGAGVPLWNTGAPAPPGTLRAGDRLDAGQSLVSSLGTYRLAVQTDGNLVVYKIGGSAIWASRTTGTGASLRMQSDGNAVLYASGRAVWNSRTGGHPGARLVMQNDGNLVVRSVSNVALWASGVPRTPTSPPANPGNSKNCSDFSTYQDAQAWFDRYYPFYGDVAALDSDGDRIACESLPGAP
jgi:hypothetical protein